MLKTNLDRGVQRDEDELRNMRNAFGSDTYLVKKEIASLVLKKDGMMEEALPLLFFWLFLQSLQFQNLNEAKRNIQIEICVITRDGRREKISVYDVVAGDVIPLKIGDPVGSRICSILDKGYSRSSTRQ
ncbi:unnamed protein product [Lactuca saligna]|uniref:Uncharacterized protein n=1 Tax=Lactuca saligna TaxID=75948 RepID=A0AA35ZGY6_LACSI|nr:unnamed protein product [Lactuca saligna]